MNQLALPLVIPETSETEFLVGDSNVRAVQMLERWATWPVMAGLLIGPRKSGKSLLARIFAAKSEGHFIDDADRVSETAIFHAWNKAQADHKPLLIVTEDLWQVKLPDLRSRLAATPLLSLQAPDDALVPLLLNKFFERRMLVAPPELILWLTKRVERSHVALIRVADALENDAHERRSPRLSITHARATLIRAGVLAESESETQ
ncbi:chromosomal replication initiator DnaA [Sphingomonas sp. AOB5]|uniref:chromosomal replication initiator DnaA n=1 Tax=Sphingomonas sp. AOB5 TaxID=3034017 RepID=UPI0023F973C1|nr:chromosomal replication initiator DnaA [Sphingomonas sp. AOB5]MDF7777173.1 chromosomal replication initiator DnaA [Sphingomonas sp. AOB5]